MTLNLRNRILLPSLALLLLVTAGLSLVSFSMSRKALDDSYDGQLRQICSSSLQQIENWVEGQKNNIVHWAAQPHVLAALQENNPTGPNRVVVSGELAHALKLYGFFANLQLMDTNGDAVACSDLSRVGNLNVLDRQYFKDAMAGRAVISAVLKNKLTGNPIVVVAAPVMEGENIRGVLSASLDLNWFSAQVIDRIKVLKTGYAVLYDEKGVFISHPNKSLILSAKLTDYAWTGPLQQAPEGDLLYTFDGVENRAMFKNSDALHWGLLVTVPVAEVLVPVQRMKHVNIFIGLGVVVVGAVVMFFTARSISRPIQQMTVNLDSCSAESISAAGQVSNASQSLAEGASEQASSLEETSASLEEMSSMTQRNADSATQANELARAARKAADGGTVDMQAMSKAMTDIKTSSDDIAKIIKTIDEIAFQTNILALNAAVEAARAGEAGAGFAVVAEEVRNLAQRSAQAAKETAAKIEGAITKTTQGVQISAKVAASLSEIVDKVRQVDTLITEVATASREQNDGVQQINRAIGQMDVVVQRNAAGAEESAAAAEELNAQALSLNEIISTLRHLVDGRASASHPLAAAEPVGQKAAALARPTPIASARGGGVRLTRVPAGAGHHDNFFKDH